MTAQPMQRVYPAGFITRTVSFVLDLMFVAVITTLLVLALGLVLDFFRATFLTAFLEGTKIASVWNLIGRVVMFIMSTVFVMFYFAFSWSLVGFTAGQFLAGVRVVRKNGELMGFWRALARILLFNLSAIVFFLGFLWVIVDRNRQAWHDKIVGTYVVYTNPPSTGRVEALEKQTAG